MEIFLTHAEGPAIRLASLLDLFEADMPSDQFQRLRASQSAQTLLGISDLAAAGFVFEIIGRKLAIAFPR